IHHRTFAVLKWLAISGMVISLYFIYALLKNEFFPVGFLGNIKPHVSFITSAMYQVSRKGGICESARLFFLWLSEDKLLIIAGLVSTLFVAVLSIIKKHIYMGLILLTLFFMYFLVRGGEVIEFYIVPLIPFFALLIGITMYEFLFFCRNHQFFYVFFSTFLITLLVLYYAVYGQTNRGYNLYTTDQTKAQLDAINWIRQNVSQQSFLVIDDYGYVDLHASNNPSEKKFPLAEYYWKIDRDSAVKVSLLDNNPSNIDIIAMTPQTDADIKQGTLTLLGAAINKSKPVKRFWSNGWGVEFWSTRFPNQILTRSWQSYKKTFLSPSGNTVDPANKGITTSEAQSYALLRAVWMNDKVQFDTSWNWTKTHMQLSNNLFGWQYNYQTSSLDPGTATDGDEDIALALAFAGKQWSDGNYIHESLDIITSIWNNEINSTSGTPFVVAGNWAKDKNYAIINPSYLSPYSYRIFAQIDSSHPWQTLVDSSYYAFDACSKATLDVQNSIYLMPDWCEIQKDGTVSPSTEKNLTATTYSYDAFRSTWRIALDYIWNKDPRAKDYLEKSDFLRKQWQQTNKILVGYTHDGKQWDNYE
ncbi:MAG: glycosyl hydrolase family 8, partial [Candidatus Levyibacteriota bacterium]